MKQDLLILYLLEKKHLANNVIRGKTSPKGQSEQGIHCFPFREYFQSTARQKKKLLVIFLSNFKEFLFLKWMRTLSEEVTLPLSVCLPFQCGQLLKERERIVSFRSQFFPVIVDPLWTGPVAQETGSRKFY